MAKRKRTHGISDGLASLAVPIADLKADPRNARTHDEANLGAIMANLREFGQRKPVVANRRNNEVEAGNGLVEAARRLGWDAVAVVWVDDDPAAQRGFALADNRTAELAAWDDEQLGLLLAEWQEDGSSQDLFDALLLGELQPKEQEGAESDADAEPQVDRAEQLREQWGVETGQLWRLGEHRLLCGDSTSAGDFGSECDAFVFDPPWDAGIRMQKRSSTLAFCDGQRIADIVGMFGAPTWAFAWDCVSSWYTRSRPLRRMKLCLWYGSIESYNPDGSHYGVPDEARVVTNTRGSYKYLPDPRGKHLSDLFAAPITRLHSESEHSHEKLLDWIRMLLANCTSGMIYDPFLGSGTTLIAAEQLGRKCYGMEISPAYCAVILQRFLDATGKRPELEKA